VYDFAFGHGTNTFATVSADGSLRQFDMRALEHSTILYETADFSPLLRVAWNKIDGNYLAALAMDSSTLTILDIRTPAVPLFELRSHENSINAISWSPTSSCHICTAGDDSSALIWDLQKTTQVVDDP
jgi:WD repeat-containing protein 68